GTDQAKVTPNDVQELRQFVDARRAKELAETGQSLLVGEKFAIQPTRVSHRSQLDDLECLFVEADPRLTKEHRATHVCAHDSGCNAENGGRRHQEARSDGPIHHSLHDETPAGLLHRRLALESSEPSMSPTRYDLNLRALSLLWRLAPLIANHEEAISRGVSWEQRSLFVLSGYLITGILLPASGGIPSALLLAALSPHLSSVLV